MKRDNGKRKSRFKPCYSCLYIIKFWGKTSTESKEESKILNQLTSRIRSPEFPVSTISQPSQGSDTMSAVA